MLFFPKTEAYASNAPHAFQNIALSYNEMYAATYAERKIPLLNILRTRDISSLTVTIPLDQNDTV